MDSLRLFSVAAVGAANIGLALTVLLRNRRSIANRAFGAAVTVVMLWLGLAFLSDQPIFSSLALLLNRLTFASAIGMGSCLVYFALVFPSSSQTLPLRWRIFFVGSVVMAAITAFTPLAISGVAFEDWGTNVLQGPLFILMAAWIVSGVAFLVIVLSKKYRRITGREKAQLKFMLLGLALFTVSALFLGLILPMLSGSYELSSLNTFASLFLVGFTAYSMVKHRFMDIRFVVLRGVAYMALVAGLAGLLVLVANLAATDLTTRMGIRPELLFGVTSLAAIMAFQPVRRLLEHSTDRFFYRRTYDPQSLLRHLGTAMASTLDLNERATLLATDLADEMRLTFAGVAFTQSGKPVTMSTGRTFDESEAQRLLVAGYGGAIVFADDPDADPVSVSVLADTEVRVLVPLMADGILLGAIVLGPKLSGEMYTSGDEAFLEILRNEASIAVKNALLYDEKNQRVRELSALNTLSSALGRDMQLDAVLDRALQQVMRVTSAEAGSIMLLDPSTRLLTIESAKGLSGQVVDSTCVRLGEGICGWVAEHRKALVLVDAIENGFGEELERQGIKSALCVPLVRRDEVVGVLNLSRVHSEEGFSKENLKVVAAFAGQLAVAIENAKLYLDLENTFLGTISALAAAVDAKDPYTFGHSSDVTDYSLAIAEEMGLSESERETLRIASLLHDIGKIGIDGAILNKPGQLSDDEYAMIKSHPQIAANILESLDFLQDVVPLVEYHHEWYSGGGYPSGRSGSEIPLGARIIAVADAYNAMTSDRTYRKAMSTKEAVRELRENAGTQFDPDVVDAFLKTLAHAQGADVTADNTVSIPEKNRSMGSAETSVSRRAV